MTRSTQPEALALKRARTAQRRLSTTLRSLAGVRGVGLGYARKGGKRDGKRGLAIVVFVRQKRKLARLTDAERLPVEVSGVPVDVLVMGRARLADSSTAALHLLHPTVVGGIAIARKGASTFGTAGAVVIDATGKAYVLTAHHVVAAKVCAGSLAGRRMSQPRQRGFTRDTHLGVVPKRGFARNRDMDAALITLDGVVGAPRKWRSAVWDDTDAGSDPVRPPPSAVTFDKPVYKIGARTGRTDGVLRHSDVVIGLPCAEGGEIEMEGQLLIEPTGSDHFLDQGDSGALVLDMQDRAVALLHGQVDITSGGETKVWGIATWLPPILTRFGVSIPT